ncbi:MAG: hypothetical protein ACLFN5_07700 [bacterium]
MVVMSQLDDQIDAFVWQPHYAQHLTPLWQELPAANRGKYYVSTHMHNMNGCGLPPEVVCVENPYELCEQLEVRPRLLIIPDDRDCMIYFLERPLARLSHGVGQSYIDEKKVPGNRKNVIVDLLPGSASREIFEEKHPETTKIVAGSPKMDRWAGFKKERDHPPTVGISFHFNHKAVPETRGTFPHYKSILPELAANNEWKLLGHGHPRFIDELIPFYEELGIDWTRDFKEILRRADLYVCDSPSTLYEFAFTDRPVVVLNAPWFRRDVEHGLRFWKYADVGIQCDGPEELSLAIRKALRDDLPQPRLRKQAVNEVYNVTDGTAGETMARRLVDFVRRTEVDVNSLETPSTNYPGLVKLLNKAVSGGRIEQPLWLAPQGMVAEFILERKDRLEFSLAGILDRSPQQSKHTEGIVLKKYSEQFEGSVLITSHRWGEEIEEELLESESFRGKIYNLFTEFEESFPWIIRELNLLKEV